MRKPFRSFKEYYPSELVGRSTDRKTVVLNAHDHEDLFHYGLRTFLQEAQTVAQLRHPHLVRVLNYFKLNDTAYLVMDYYEGEDLGRHLKPPKGLGGQPMPWRRALKLLLPVLDGLQKVHQAGFMMDSEPALGRGYGDLLLRVRPDMRQYALLDHLLEFKAVSLKEIGLTSAELAAKSRDELRTMPAVVEKLREAENQLTTYRAILERDAPLKLRTHAVVGIGLERLV